MLRGVGLLRVGFLKSVVEGWGERGVGLDRGRVGLMKDRGIRDILLLIGFPKVIGFLLEIEIGIWEKIEEIETEEIEIWEEIWEEILTRVATTEEWVVGEWIEVWIGVVIDILIVVVLGLDLIDLYLEDIVMIDLQIVADLIVVVDLVIDLQHVLKDQILPEDQIVVIDQKEVAIDQKEVAIELIVGEVVLVVVIVAENEAEIAVTSARGKPKQF
jgi:hypothetical protein